MKRILAVFLLHYKSILSLTPYTSRLQNMFLGFIVILISPVHCFLYRSVAIWRGCDSIEVQAFIRTRFSVFVPCCLHGSSGCCDLQSPVLTKRSCLNWDHKDKRSSSIPASFLTKKKLFLKLNLNTFRKNPQSGLWQPCISIHCRSLQLIGACENNFYLSANKYIYISPMIPKQFVEN